MVNPLLEETKPNPLVKIYADFIYYGTDWTIERVPQHLRADVTALLETYPADPYFDDHRHHIADVDGLQEELDGKVLKVTGKGLSANDYTTAEKEKLAGVAPNANNYAHPASHPASMITQNATNRFVTDVEKAAWNGKSDFSGSYADLSNKPVIPAAVTLNNTVTSTSTTQAATANSVKTAYDRAQAAFQSASDGKTLLANAITGKGVVASGDDAFGVLAGKIGSISTGVKVVKGSFTGTHASPVPPVTVPLDFNPSLVLISYSGSSMVFSKFARDGYLIGKNGVGNIDALRFEELALVITQSPYSYAETIYWIAIE
ncbi:tail fiber protein [Planococcus beigongshangi]|uniref:tail fiber protein n=1 Tax=Planococcus beigongshangi TaxID=2782536 RepID=UPI001EEE6D3A|nr:tail fiber protein [Planococcus beigongshangi]